MQQHALWAASGRTPVLHFCSLELLAACQLGWERWAIEQSHAAGSSLCTLP